MNRFPKLGRVLPTSDLAGTAVSRPGRRREGAVVAAAFVICLLGGTVRVEDALSAPPLAAYLLALASAAVLPARHRRPLAVLAATTAAGLVAQPLGLVLSPLVIAPALVAAYACTLNVPGERRAAGAVTLAGVALLAGSVPLAGDLSWQDASRIGSVPAAPLVAGLVGHAARTRRAYLAAVEERARRAEESRELEARRRVAEERVRIARELHDLVAHQITLANAQATVAAHFVDSRPEQTRVSLRELVETTGQALDELRATVGLLRQTGDGDTGVPEGPAPGLARLPDLLESFRRAGLEVVVRETGRARALPPGVDLTAYRIVQEALTNVTKHASGRGARVGLDWGGGRLTVTVADDGGAPSGPPALSDRPPGYGLIGLRERAAAVGGELTAAPRKEGGFLVTAHLPFPPARDAAAAGEEGRTRRADGGTEGTT
ncbi:sensor histidine kinase [Streptomyces lusitanus]|uniref:histidine kinase n=1 Tax=Streptomyces lusitanus TaxID=68232 RepID=A0ABU3JYV9_9ACTN|nr:histidine kinase [Streptomyces lusitanus]